MRNVQLIFAKTRKGGIGDGGALPWRIRKDFQYFSNVTSFVRMTTTATSERDKQTEGDKDPERKTNAVVMGRVTWESIAEKFRPLANRTNIVISQTLGVDAVPQGVYVVQSIDAALSLVNDDAAVAKRINDVYIIGGAKMYEEFMNVRHSLVQHIYVTRIGKDYKCDTSICEVPADNFVPVSVSKTYSEGDTAFDFVVYLNKSMYLSVKKGFDEWVSLEEAFTTAAKMEIVPRPVVCLESVQSRNHGEFLYLDLIKEIIGKGQKFEDRTGVGTYGVFGRTLRFDLRQSFPLLTTKRVFWSGVVGELLWFIKGDTNALHLSDIGIKIWDGNSSREFLDSRGLQHREVGDLGPVYGFQWRHFGASYKDMQTDYTGAGVDQLQNCINSIKNNPSDRRIIMSAWNPAALADMALPPCHMFCQFHVENGALSCAMYQRSADMGLGVPFNIASYSLLTVMMAHVCGLKCGDFYHVLGNAHVYLNHIDPLKAQLSRIPRPFPLLKIKRDVTSIDDFVASDFELTGYDPYPKIQMEMAV